MQCSNPEGSKIFAEHCQWFEIITLDNILRFMPSGGHLFIQWIIKDKDYKQSTEKVKKEIANYFNIPYEKFFENWNNYLYLEEKFVAEKIVLNIIIKMG